MNAHQKAEKAKGGMIITDVILVLWYQASEPSIRVQVVRHSTSFLAYFPSSAVCRYA